MYRPCFEALTTGFVSLQWEMQWVNPKFEKCMPAILSVQKIPAPSVTPTFPSNSRSRETLDLDMMFRPSLICIITRYYSYTEAFDLEHGWNCHGDRRRHRIGCLLAKDVKSCFRMQHSRKSMKCYIYSCVLSMFGISDPQKCCPWLRFVFKRSILLIDASCQ